MTWKCAFNKLYVIAQAHDVAVDCAPKNFTEFWCLLDKITAAIAEETPEEVQPVVEEV